jgi:hypothetical protein
MADDPSVLAGTLGSRRALEESEKALEEVLEAFDVLADRIKNSDDDVAPAEISKSRLVLAQVRTQLSEEVSKHEKRVLQSAGLTADAPLDFDVLRASIGRKLDRIRDAGDAE